MTCLQVPGPYAPTNVSSHNASAPATSVPVMRRLLVCSIALGTTIFVAPAVAAQPADDRDCSDFATQQEAQEFFENAGPNDPHGLDQDGDGIACETVSAQATPTPVPAATPASGNSLPNNGGPLMLFGLSGLGLLGAGASLRRIHRNLRELETQAIETVPPQMPTYRAVIDRASRTY